MIENINIYDHEPATPDMIILNRKKVSNKAKPKRILDNSLKVGLQIRFIGNAYIGCIKNTTSK